MISEIGAIICAALIMLFVLGCGVLALLVVTAKTVQAPPPPERPKPKLRFGSITSRNSWAKVDQMQLIIDPENPEYALTKDGELIIAPRGLAS